jgi:hypothetical protein
MFSDLRVERDRAIMLKFGDIPSEELSEKTELYVPKWSTFHVVRIMLATFFSGFALLSSALTQADTEAPAVAQMPDVIILPLEIDTSDSSNKDPVSPYARANWQHAPASKGEHVRSLAITVGHPGVPTGQGKRH